MSTVITGGTIMLEAIEVRNRYRMEEWTQIISQCRASGLSNRDFCRQNGIPEKTFYYRLRKLREKVAESEITLCRLETESSPGAGSSVRVKYRGADIEVSKDTDPDALKLALGALSEI